MRNIAIAMTNAHCDGQATANRDQYLALLAVSEAIVSHRDLEALFSGLAEALHKVVRFDYLMLILHDAATDSMREHVLEPSDPTLLSSQNFWNHMDLVTADQILEFEQQMTARLIQRFQIDLRALVYDGTNFFTYINTRTPSQLPQRGHNKQKRGDLRQVIWACW